MNDLTKTPDDLVLDLEDAVRTYGPAITSVEGVWAHRSTLEEADYAGSLCGHTTVIIPAEIADRLNGIAHAVDKVDPGHDVVLVYAAKTVKGGLFAGDGYDIEFGIALDTPENRAYVFDLDLWYVHRMRREDLPAKAAEAHCGLPKDRFGTADAVRLAVAPPAFESTELREYGLDALRRWSEAAGATAEAGEADGGSAGDGAAVDVG